jgi:hypothetical protein
MGNKKILRNMIVMVFLWIACSFSYYLINFEMKYIKGDLYINSIFGSLADCMAYGSSAFILKKIGLKNTLIVSYALGMSGMLCLFLSQTERQQWLTLFILVSKFGISCSFNIVWVANFQMFPVSIIGTSYGICGMVARLFTIAAPPIAEIKPDYVPQLFFITMNGLAMLASTLLIIEKEENKAKSNLKEMIPVKNPESEA